MPKASAPITLSTPLADSSYVTERQSKLLADLGLTNVGSLLAHLPLRHERLEDEATIDQITPGTHAAARGEVSAMRVVRGPKPRVEAVILDHTGRLDVCWFHASYLRDQLAPGLRVRVQGLAKRRGPQIQMVNPRLDILKEGDAQEPTRLAGRLRPIYPASEKLTSKEIEKILTKVLPVALPLLEEHLPEEFRAKRALPALADAYRMMHTPADADEAASARRRLAFDELFLLQLAVHMKRAHLREKLHAPALSVGPALDARIRARLPFSLTPAQERVVSEISEDLAHATPMNRLLQGDVGSGKTAVAVYAMLAAVARSSQAALMAPTEILAEQHAATLDRWLEGSRVRRALLTGNTPRAERSSTLASLADGALDIIVGTHALLSEGVVFKNLGLAVIDEQHRFGVAQRAALRASASDGLSTPHVLVMTATPIPRSLALTLFGDLDVCVIDALPPGRSPIATHIVDAEHRATAYAELARRIELGEQGYIVVPAIEPGFAGSSEVSAAPLIDLRTVMDAVESTFLSGKRVAALHARMPRAERSAVMERFRLGQIHALVATTVIEVGVDVPNATTMIIEQADRFGLAQLHQLRGRIGRGSAASVCYAVASESSTEGSARLAAFAKTTDGFALAEKDLELRGMGQFFGVRQSGLPPFRVAEFPKDRRLLDLCRRDAAEWVDNNPPLDAPEKPGAQSALSRRVRAVYGEYFGLGDVG